MPSMTKWEVLIETRTVGAIGEFVDRTLFTVRADTQDQAVQYALEDAQMYGFEPRHVIEVIGPKQWP